MNDKYYVVSGPEDGDIRIYEYNRTELLKMLKEDFDENFPPDIMDRLGDNNDPMYWGDSIIIIKGKIVKPKQVEVVKKWDIE